MQLGISPPYPSGGRDLNIASAILVQNDWNWKGQFEKQDYVMNIRQSTHTTSPKRGEVIPILQMQKLGSSPAKDPYSSGV